MATALYLRSDLSDLDLSGDTERLLSLVAGSSPGAYQTTTVSGPASVQVTAGTTPQTWFSNPLSAVTISGTITFIVRDAQESNMNANATIRVLVERTNGSGTVQSTIVNSSRGTELGTSAVDISWTATPTSTALSDGDRIKVTLFVTDATASTMAAGHTVTIVANGTAAATQDTNVTFTETITEYTPPSGAALEGSSAGTSTAAATALTQTQPLAGSTAGASTGAATALTLEHALTGSAAGTSTAGATQLSGPAAVLEGATDGTSTASATSLTLPHALSGASAGVSTAAGTLTLSTHALAGASDGASTAAALSLALIAALTGQSDGTSTAGGTGLSMAVIALAGASVGTGTASGDLTMPGGAAALAGNAAGTSTASAAGLALDHALTGMTDGTSATGADRLIVADQPLIGSSNGDSNAEAVALVLLTVALMGAVAGVSTATGDLVVTALVEAGAVEGGGITPGMTLGIQRAAAIGGRSVGTAVDGGVTVAGVRAGPAGGHVGGGIG